MSDYPSLYYFDEVRPLYENEFPKSKQPQLYTKLFISTYFVFQIDMVCRFSYNLFTNLGYLELSLVTGRLLLIHWLISWTLFYRNPK